MNIQPIIEGHYFHIYNRGVNSEDIFKEKDNYYYFLEKYKFYCGKALKTLAYCLLKNHFHLLVFINEKVEVPRTDGKEGLFRLNASKQLGHLFNSYAQSINKKYDRTGPLFESPFERKLVCNERYLMSLIHYCNQNAVHHGFVKNINDWEFSSYHDVLNNNNSIVAVGEILERFGNKERFKESHKQPLLKEDFKESIIEITT